MISVSKTEAGLRVLGNDTTGAGSPSVVHCWANRSICEWLGASNSGHWCAQKSRLAVAMALGMHVPPTPPHLHPTPASDGKKAGPLHGVLYALSRQRSLALEGGYHRVSGVPSMSQCVECLVFTTLGLWLAQQMAFLSFTTERL